jgi:hypothetical protein
MRHLVEEHLSILSPWRLNEAQEEVRHGGLLPGRLVQAEVLRAKRLARQS